MKNAGRYLDAMRRAYYQVAKSKHAHCRTGQTVGPQYIGAEASLGMVISIRLRQSVPSPYSRVKTVAIKPDHCEQSEIMATRWLENAIIIDDGHGKVSVAA